MAPFRMARAIELGATRFALTTTRLIGVMTAAADEAVGRVYPDGSVSKLFCAAAAQVELPSQDGVVAEDVEGADAEGEWRVTGGNREFR